MLIPLSQELVDWAQVVGAALSLLALVLALYALWKAKRDLAAERRMAHELEVLRDLSEIIEQFGLGLVPRLRSSLLLLPGSDDLPLLRSAVDVRPSALAVVTFN